MALKANTHTRYDAVGVREDLSDIIYDISPTETPVLTAAAKEDVENTYFEWQVDELAAPDGANAHLEGDEAENDALTTTDRVGNYTQISKKVPSVTGTAQKVKMAGRKSEMARQVAKKAKEMKRDMETIILSNQAAVAGSNAVARKTGGLGAIIYTNVDMGATGANPSYTNGAPLTARTDGTQRAVTEDMVKDVAQLIWTNGGTPKLVSFGAFNKVAASAFAGNAQKTVEQTGKGSIVASADIYKSDFGNIAFVANRYQRARDAWFLDTEYLSVAYLRRFRREKLAKTGDAVREQLLVEWGVKVHTEKAHGLIADLTTA